MSARIEVAAARELPPSDAASLLLWRTVLTGTVRVESVDPPTADMVRMLGRRLAARCSAGWAASLLAPLTPLLGGPVIDPAAAAASMLLSKLTLAAQVTALRRMTEAGLHPIVLKGLANAHRIYDTPMPRVLGDLDVLLPRAEIGAAIDVFSPLGYRFGSARRTRWGFVSDASYVPFHSPDGVTNIDLHVQPDAWPLPLGLAADDVRAGARTLTITDGAIRMPRDEHVLLICVSNIAKDRFDWRCMSKVIDVARLLVRHGQALDWREIEDRAACARLGRPLDALLALLTALGLPAALVPRAVAPPRGLAGRTWRRIMVDWRGVFAAELSGADLLWRDLTLIQTPATFARFNWWRVKGLVRPADGIPPEARARGLA